MTTRNSSNHPESIPDSCIHIGGINTQVPVVTAVSCPLTDARASMHSYLSGRLLLDMQPLSIICRHFRKLWVIYYSLVTLFCLYWAKLTSFAWKLRTLIQCLFKYASTHTNRLAFYLSKYNHIVHTVQNLCKTYFFLSNIFWSCSHVKIVFFK
jgi:hypothetical protein